MSQHKIGKIMLNCPCCDNYYEVDTGDERYIGEICPICFWQYDIVGQEQVDIAIGPNKVSLIEARKNYEKFGASTERLIPLVRKPHEDELPENN
ncbi:CPCC family cysteine-rich protein [Erysipelothrix sp. HDW6C]|uniref:CPCC family cysteine-rich protein n=1 Tax=Erysipelothrix sp. HDW6C TaxID=2714930 RepID=UPI00196B2401|nr:CPCC family cysteine-rich protein [Erysipelothrix sp. HDW6C]